MLWEVEEGGDGEVGRRGNDGGLDEMGLCLNVNKYENINTANSYIWSDKLKDVTFLE